MTAQCSQCRRPVLSRQHGAVKILGIICSVDDPFEPRVVLNTDETHYLLSEEKLVELRDICNEMVCSCERSVAEAEAA